MLAYYIVTALNVPDDVEALFLLSVPNALKDMLLRSASLLVYTPSNEHFGIGPVEAMACGLPVLACNSGGPTESVLTSPPEERIGWLCPPEEEGWAATLSEILRLTIDERIALAERAKARAQDLFGMEAMASGIQKALYDAVDMGSLEKPSYARDVVLAMAISLLAYSIYLFIV